MARNKEGSGSDNVKRIKTIARKAFGTQAAFCEQAGLRQHDFPTKLKVMDKRVDEYNVFLQQFDLKYKLVSIDKDISSKDLLYDFITWYNSKPKLKKPADGLITIGIVKEYLPNEES